MKNSKKCISLILSLLMVFGVFNIVPISTAAKEINASATGATSGTTGKCKWSLNGTVLTISGNGMMGDYSGVGPWGRNISEVILTDGVTNIGNYAFSYCKGLTSITIPDSVISIGEDTFSGCTGLTKVTIGNSVASIGELAFEECSGLTSISVSPNNSVYDSRDNCNAIIKTKTNTLIRGCQNTIIPDTVVSIDYWAFDYCTGLTSITIPDSVTHIGEWAFQGCSGLTSVSVSPDNRVYDSRDNCNAKKETKTNTLIVGCQKTRIPETVTSIGKGAFFGCTGLTSITIPNSVTTISDFAFTDCMGLTSITIPDSVISIGTDAVGYYYLYGDTRRSVDNCTIYGYGGSTAERYANKNDIRFIKAKGKCDNCQSILLEDRYRKGYPATCDKDGLTDGYICQSCGYQTQAIIPASGHTPVTDKAVASDCTQTGLTEGSHCSVCDEVLVTQEIIPAKGHTLVTDKAVPATCTETGLTEGSHCSVCGEVFVKQETVPKLGHDYVKVEAVEADCTHDGATIGVKCTRCEEWLFAQETVPALGHKEVVDEGRPATTTETGLTEGSHCSVCGEIIKAQEIIPIIDDERVIGDIDGDGEITPMDVTEVQHYLSTMTTHVDEAALMFADVDQNGRLEIIDTTWLQRYLAGMEIPYKIG